jgi:hypothetical protein
VHRQHRIQQHQLRRLAMFDRFHGLQPVFRHAHLPSMPLEQEAQQVGDRAIVLDHQGAAGRGGGSGVGVHRGILVA